MTPPPNSHPPRRAARPPLHRNQPETTAAADDLARRHARPEATSGVPEPAAGREYYADGRVRLLLGDALAVLRELPDGLADTVVTSPPYFWTRDYGAAGQYGLEATPQDYLDTLRAVMAQAHRVLAPHGVLWLNLADSHSQRTAIRASSHQEGLHGARGARPAWRELTRAGRTRLPAHNLINHRPVPEKSLLLLPERLLVALAEDGWLIRSKIVWAKTTCLPDPAADRPARRWEPLFLLTKSRHYSYNRAAAPRGDVWSLPASRGTGAHFASYPVDLPQRCIAASCPEDGLVLDPFSGSGTTALAAHRQNRRYLGIDLRADYHDLALDRLGLSRTPAVLRQGGGAA
ncbi:site-specific DNA-methyltransferase [Streptomyces sp. DSM 44917]|uniref:Methyltransferase n=1 Tax=Streptomyces boetiae TaxID=3075541 RepID=A0ABU2L6V0_9ACTN|nr:site-specific DNA-methyltransferase [Streptomyces sp. DSM 44917]MDT0307212.1 site-specific DNA-methyltransferase [Streptomyces sp. DSM 44917]